MTLNNYLQTLNPNQLVAIGTKYGEGFLYIEKASDTDSISKQFKNSLKNTMNGLEYKYALLKDLFINAPILTGDLDIDWPIVCERCDRMMETCWGIDRARTCIEEFVPVLEREVLEDYDRAIDDAVVILVDGRESGPFWLHEEYLETFPVKKD